MVTSAYEIASPGFLGPLTDALFVRSQWRRSLERTLAHLRLEAEEATAGAPQS